MTNPDAAPTAEVVWMRGPIVQVRCPYCGAGHKHDLRAVQHGARTRRAAGCGLNMSARQRLTGYWITKPERER